MKNIYILFSIFIFFLILLPGFHTNSIGMYNRYFYGENNQDKDVKFSIPRAIRSDEWMTGSNIFIVVHNQIHDNLGLNLNTSIQKYIHSYYFNWTVVLRPANIALFVPYLEQSMSLYFVLRLILFVLPLSILMSKLWGNKLIHSLIAVFLLIYSAFFQWWFATTIIEILGYGAIVILSAISLFNLESSHKKTIVSIMLSYFLSCFLILLYPPFQLAFIYFALALFFGYLLNHRLITNDNLKKVVPYYVLTLVLVSLIVAGYVYTNWTYIQTMQNTSYPGQRIVQSGGYDWRHFFNGFYNIQLLDDVKGSASFGNQSEASTFFLLFPVIVPYILYRTWKNYREKQKIDFILLFVSLYLLLITSWMFGFLPQQVGNILLLHLIPHNRAMFGVGVASIFLMLYFLYKKDFGKPHIIYTLLVSLGFFALHLEMGYWFRQNYPLFIQSIPKIVLISMVAGGAVFLLLRRHVKAFLLLITIFSFISTYRVNPIYAGTDVITDSPLSNAISRIEDVNKGQYMWIVYDSFIMPNYFTANGAPVLNGTHMSPQLDLWKKFDPGGKYFDIYNRFAHVKFASHESSDIDFELDYTDTFTVTINPCKKILSNVGVKYHVFHEEVKYSCLQAVDHVIFPEMEFYIYERK